MDIWGPFIANVGRWCQEWLPVISQVGVFLVALIAFLSYRQALDSGKRDQWWARAQWAIESVLDTTGNRRLTGLIVLTSLKTSRLATRQDAALFDSVAAELQASIAGPPPGQGQGQEQEPPPGPGKWPKPAPYRPAAAPFDVELSALGARTVSVDSPRDVLLLEQAEKLLLAKPDPAAR